VALTYDLGKITDWQSVCQIVAVDDEQMRGIKAGDRVQNPVTTTLIHATMAVGLGSITEANAQQFYARLATYERLFGAFMYRGTDWPEGQGPEITAEEVIAHIGLACNVSDETDSKWSKRMMEHALSDWTRVFTRASERLDKERLAEKIA